MKRIYIRSLVIGFALGSTGTIPLTFFWFCWLILKVLKKTLYTKEISPRVKIEPILGGYKYQNS